MISRMLKMLCVVLLIQSYAVKAKKTCDAYEVWEIRYENPKRKGGRHDIFPYWINETKILKEKL